MAAAALLFVLGIVAGYLVAVTHPSLAMAELQPSMTKLEEVGHRVTASNSPVERALLIYVNNVVALWAMLEGGLLAGTIPAVAMLFNGAVMGVVMGLGAKLSPVGASPLTLALAIVPHGIFELPAVWFGGAWGMRLGLTWLRPDAAGQRRRVFKRSAIEAAQVFVLAAALLLVAAFVEGNVTTALVRSAHA